MVLRQHHMVVLQLAREGDAERRLHGDEAGARRSRRAEQCVHVRSAPYDCRTSNT